MSVRRYLLDNNALGFLTIDERASAFVRNFCMIPTEVLYEARDFPDSEHLASLEYRMDTGVLDNLIIVMAKLSTKGKPLVDLYHNRGNADPLLIATAMHADSAYQDTLMPDEWWIVTDDQGVQTTADQFGIQHIPPIKLRQLISKN